MLAVTLTVENRRAQSGRNEVCGHGRQTLRGNGRSHDTANGAVKARPQGHVIDVIILNASLDESADNFRERNRAVQSSTSSFGNSLGVNR